MNYILETPKKTYYGFDINRVREKYARYPNEAFLDRNMYKPVYMGYWARKTKSGYWMDNPVDVFYQPNPNKDLGHTNYFGLFSVPTYPYDLLDSRDYTTYICDASSCFSEPIECLLLPSGEVLVSRYRHDFRQAKTANIAIDGGRDYTRLVGDLTAFAKYGIITVEGPNFIVKEKLNEDLNVANCA